MSEENIFFQSKMLKDLIAGCTGGVACTLSGQPLDTMKVKLQVFPEKYGGLVKCFRTIWSQEGISGFYRGSLPAIACSVMENGVAFLSYNRCLSISRSIMSYLSNDSSDMSYDVAAKLCAGASTGFLTSFIITPSEMFKCKLQTMHEFKDVKKRNFATLFRNVLAEDGVKGLFTGLQPTMCREMIGYSLIFGGYEVTKHYLAPYDIGISTDLLGGSVGGMSYWLVLYPIDVLKSRIQVFSQHHLKISTVIRDICKKEGVKALYSGITPTLMRAILANGCLFYTYSETLNVIDKLW